MAIPAATPHRFTLEDYHRMAELGVLRDDDRVELVEGEIIEMSPIGVRHALCVTALNDIFHHSSVDAVIWVQCPLQLSPAAQLQPDLALLKPPRQRYKPDRIPRPDDVFLVIEVADSSFLYDRDTKARLYAQADIAEYWLVDLTQSTLWVHQQPVGGHYSLMTPVRADEIARPTNFPNCAIPVGELLP